MASYENWQHLFTLWEQSRIKDEVAKEKIKKQLEEAEDSNAGFWECLTNELFPNSKKEVFTVMHPVTLVAPNWRPFAVVEEEFKKANLGGSILLMVPIPSIAPELRILVVYR
jgi:hypothetical protein